MRKVYTIKMFFTIIINSEIFGCEINVWKAIFRDT